MRVNKMNVNCNKNICRRVQILLSYQKECKTLQMFKKTVIVPKSIVKNLFGQSCLKCNIHKNIIKSVGFLQRTCIILNLLTIFEFNKITQKLL